GSIHQDGSDDRQPRLPIYLQLLYRFSHSLSAAGHRGDQGRFEISFTKVQKAACRVARSKLWSALQRRNGRDRGGRTSRQHRLYRREQFVASLGVALETSEAKWIQGAASRNRVMVRPG